jgi:UDP-3-O-[3-hydroxymyristoyl] glucosamine N-acyltransferase
MSGSPGFSLADLAAHIGATLVGAPDTLITGIATLQDAHAGQLAFLANAKYRKYLATTGASAVILAPDQADGFSGNALVIANPYHAYARLTGLFARKPRSGHGVHPSAVVADSAQLGRDISIGPQVTIEANAVIGDGVIIGAGSFIGEDCRIGADSLIHPNVTICYGSRLGARAIIHSGVVIGADGFGFAPHGSGWTKIHHLADVTIGDDVELGAGTCVDRGALADTTIGNGVKVDNMVQIAHGVKVGENTVIAACTGIAGSVEIGANCVIAGGVGIVGHIRIADKVTITAMTMVTKSITEPGSYSSGSPMATTREWRRQAVRVGQLEEINQRLKRLENRDP